MSSKADQKALTHERILGSAARLLRKHGIAGARVSEVMKGAGLTVGGFYAHFDSKEALVDDVLRVAAAKSRERLFHALGELPERERLRTLLERYLSPAHRDAVPEGCIFPAVVGEVATTAPEHRNVLVEEIERFTTEVESHLSHKNRASRRRFALALFALMYGGLALSRAVAGTMLADEILAACRAFGQRALEGAPS